MPWLNLFLRLTNMIDIISQLPNLDYIRLIINPNLK